MKVVFITFSDLLLIVGGLSLLTGPAYMKNHFALAVLAFILLLAQFPANANPARRAAASPPRKAIYLPAKISSDNYVADMDYAEYWQPKRMPLKVFVQDCSTVPNYDPAYVDAFKAACEDWSTATGNKIRFVYTDSEKEADIEVRWTENRSAWPSDGKNELGVTQMSMFGGQQGLDHAIIYLLTTDFQNHKQMGIRAMKEIATHELGHAFGLGHSSLETDIMYKSVELYPCVIDGRDRMETRKSTELSSRDASTMNVVYEAKQTLDRVREKQLDPQNACAELINESVKQNDRGDYAQAIIYLQEALRIDGNNHIAMNNLIAIYYNCGISRSNNKQYKQAVIPINRAIYFSQKQGNQERVRQMTTIRTSCMRAGGLHE